MFRSKNIVLKEAVFLLQILLSGHYTVKYIAKLYNIRTSYLLKILIFTYIFFVDSHVTSLPISFTVAVQYFIRNLIKVYSINYCNYLIQKL
jgi:hypothetical protein